MKKLQRLTSLFLLAAPAALAQTPAAPLVASALVVGDTAPAFKG